MMFLRFQSEAFLFDFEGKAVKEQGVHKQLKMDLGIRLAAVWEKLTKDSNFFLAFCYWDTFLNMVMGHI